MTGAACDDPCDYGLSVRAIRNPFQLPGVVASEAPRLAERKALVSLDQDPPRRRRPGTNAAMASALAAASRSARSVAARARASALRASARRSIWISGGSSAALAADARKAINAMTTRAMAWSAIKGRPSATGPAQYPRSDVRLHGHDRCRPLPPEPWLPGMADLLEFVYLRIHTRPRPRRGTVQGPRRKSPASQGCLRLSARGVPFRALSGDLRSHFNVVQRLCEATGVPIRRELPSDPDLSTTE